MLVKVTCSASVGSTALASSSGPFFFPFLFEVALSVNTVDTKALFKLNFQSCFSFVDVAEVVFL